MSKMEIQEIRNEVFAATSALLSITARLDALKAQPEPVAPAKARRWRPKEGDRYWVIFPNGDPASQKWLGSDYDLRAHARGAIYQTEAAAIYTDKATQALTAMRDWVAAAGFVPDWEDGHTKFFPLYDHKEKRWYVEMNCRIQTPSAFYFISEASCLAFLKEFGPGEGREDRLKYLLDGGWL